MEFVINESTRTLHKRRSGSTARHTVCGVTRTLDAERLQPIPGEVATAECDADRCGRCFEDAGGY